MPELKRDMEILKNNGFNLIKLQEHWMIDEPQEGHYDFSRYEELIEHARMLDLGVYLGLTCEQAPGWLYEKHPGCRMVGRDGRTIVYEAQMTLPADGKPGPCYDHPGAMADQVRFIKKLVETLGRYENVVVWNTWQEIGYWSQTLVGQPVCYCENTLNSFRRFLQEKYGDLDCLNRAWRTRYGDWRYVQPDRGAYGQNALPQDIDWAYFMDNIQVASILRSRAQAIKEADPLHRPVFAHKGGIALGYGTDWTYARTQDFLGSSCYPAWNPFHRWDDGAPQPGRRPERTQALANEMSHGVALTYDQIRSCNPSGAPVWAAEFQGGPVNTFIHKGRVPSAADIRRWMLTAASAGVTGISFWVARAEIMAQETNGFALLDSTGETTSRLREAGRVGAALNRHADLFGQPSWGGAEVAILVNEWNAQFCATYPPAGDHLAYDTRGWHRLLWEENIPADFIEAGEFENRYGNYKAIVLPFPVSISENLAAELSRYVERGGHLICEVAPGRLNEHGVANRGELSPTLAGLFGVRHHSIALLCEPNHEARWTPTERTWGEFLGETLLDGAGPLAGQQTRANLYVETFEAVASQPILRYGEEVAGVVREAGQGKAWLLGTCLGHSGTAYRNPQTHSFVRLLLEACGVRPIHAGRLKLRKRSVRGHAAWFFTNPADEPVTETVDVGSAWVEDLFGDPIQQECSQVILTVDGLDVRVLIVRDMEHDLRQECIDMPIPLRIRGLMLDAARLVETLDYYKRFIDFCVAWNVNTVVFRTADDQGCAIRFQSHPELLTHPNALNHEQVRDLVNYARLRGVELLPEVESFGHTHYITGTPEHAELSDKGTEGETWAEVVIPLHPETMQILTDLYREVAELFPSPYLHGGCDEVNWGASDYSARLLRTRSRSQVWGEYLNALQALALSAGKEFLVWGDHVLRRQPDILDYLDKRVIILDWEYADTDPITVAAIAERAIERGFRVVGGPALQWGQWGPRIGSDQLRNVDAFADVYRNLKSPLALGVIVTNWVPTRYLQNAIWDSLAYAATAMSEGSAVAREEAFPRFVARHYGCEWDADWDGAFRTLYGYMPPKRFASGRIPLVVPWADLAALHAAVTAKEQLEPPLADLRARLEQVAPLIRRNQADFAALCLTVEYLEHVYWRHRIVAAEAPAAARDREVAGCLMRDIAERDRQMADKLRQDWNTGRDPAGVEKEAEPGQHAMFGFEEKDYLMAHLLAAVRFSGELAQDPERYISILQAEVQR
jgi:beta-galactosidase GanA